MNDGLKQAHFDAILSVLSSHPHVEKVVLFGSRAMGTFTPDSDVDLCLYGDALTLTDQARLQSRLEGLSMPQSVDVVLHHLVKEPALLKHIQREGKVVFEREAGGKELGSGMRGEWGRHKIEDLLRTGKLLIGDGYRAKNNELKPSGVPFARAGNINDGFRFHDAEYFPQESLSRVGNKLSEPGDVVFTSKGTVGRFAFVRPTTVRFVYSPQLCFWRSRDHDTIDPRFLYYWMHGREFYVQYKGVAGQTDMAEYVSLTDQRRMYITLPELNQQRAIAHILGTLDDKIELNRRMNETLEAMARAVFKSWFVDFDPVRAKAEGRSPAGMDAETAALFPSEFVDSELGRIPKGWRVLPVYDLATYVNGAAYKAFQPNNEGRGLPIIKIAELKSGVTAQTSFSEVEMPKKYRLRTGDILFSWSGNPDTSIDTFVWVHGPAWLNQHIFRVDPHSNEERSFVLATLKYLRPVFAELARNKQTTGLGHVTAGDMKRLLVIKPVNRVLQAWDRIAAPLFGAALQAEQESLSLACIRDTLLPRLLSGELSVAEAERAVGASI